MHEEGFKKALTNVLNRYARAKGVLKEKDDNLIGEDIREGLIAIVSVKLRDPQFEGQTKTKLGNTEMRSLVETTVNDEARRVARGAPGRGQAHRAEGLRRPRRRAWPPSRPATSRGASRCSSGVDARQARRLPAERPRQLRDVHRRGRLGRRLAPSRPANPATQAILPIRGKILNVEKARLHKISENVEIQALITAIGTGIGDEFDLEKARYHRIVIMADADVDGAHIRTLLLTFFFRQHAAS